MPRKYTQRQLDAMEIEEQERLVADLPPVHVANAPEATNATVAEFVIPFLLDVEGRYTYTDVARQVAAHFNVSYTVRDLHELFRTDEFMSRWPLTERGYDPRVDVVKQAFADMLHLAVTEAKNLLSSPNTPASVKSKLIDRVMEMSSVKAEPQKESNTRELIDYLSGLGVRDVTQINIGTLIQHGLEDEYREAEEMVHNPTPEHNLISHRAGEDGLIVDGEFDEADDTEDFE